MKMQKKVNAAILIFDVILGLLLLFVLANKQGKFVVGVLSQKVAYSENAEQKKIAITFDDGPHPYYTEQLLDGLKERGVTATFFVTGEHAKLHPDVIKRMQEEGHLIGNHTYSHIQLTAKNREAFKQELIDTNAVIEEITGEEVQYVRPPYGTWDKKFETELNMFPVLWTIDPLDWCSSNADCIASKVVDELQKEGYTFVTVEEILFD